MPGVNSLTLEYFDGENWTTTWDSTQEDNTVPAAVRMTLQLDRTAADGSPHTYQTVRTFTLPCSTVAQDNTLQ